MLRNARIAISTIILTVNCIDYFQCDTLVCAQKHFKKMRFPELVTNKYVFLLMTYYKYHRCRLGFISEK